MRGNKFEKSNIHILESETLSRESRVTESAKEIDVSIPCNCEWYSYITSCQHFYTLGGGCFTRIGDFTWRVSDCEELSGGGYSQEVIVYSVNVLIFWFPACHTKSLDKNIGQT